MNQRPPYASLCLVASGALSLLVLYFLSAVGSQRRLLASAAGGAFVLLIPVMLRGNSWHKMLAGIMLFVPSFGLVAALMD